MVDRRTAVASTNRRSWSARVGVLAPTLRPGPSAGGTGPTDARLYVYGPSPAGTAGRRSSPYRRNG